MAEIFRKFAHAVANIVGTASTFLIAISVVIVWALTGPIFGFSDTWQLVINTGTTIVTFLMVFLIQNSQNRDARAIHLKLDELLRAVGGARTSLVNLESLSDAKLLELQHEFEKLQKNFGLEEAHSEHIANELQARQRDPRKRKGKQHLQ
jgi:low affinity Fe/Cu permease